MSGANIVSSGACSNPVSSSLLNSLKGLPVILSVNDIRAWSAGFNALLGSAPIPLRASNLICNGNRPNIPANPVTVSPATSRVVCPSGGRISPSANVGKNPTAPTPALAIARGNCSTPASAKDSGTPKNLSIPPSARSCISAIGREVGSGTKSASCTGGIPALTGSNKSVGGAVILSPTNPSPKNSEAVGLRVDCDKNSSAVGIIVGHPDYELTQESLLSSCHL